MHDWLGDICCRIYRVVCQERERDLCTDYCHVTHYICRSLDYLSITLRYSGLFGLVCNSPVQGQVITIYLQRGSHSYLHHNFPTRAKRCTPPWFPGSWIDDIADGMPIGQHRDLKSETSRGMIRLFKGNGFGGC
ncbi:hypothetical protein ACN42_g1861 [Penicillium freii]|uniref:Uncharacterized protein n=1 Tax=Penicillium freii TaxID=48697 RepID=A0A117NRA4_PENFR|nr:hypothetical protein ACN42_g1861 [Penicillium freii]